MCLYDFMIERMVIFLPAIPTTIGYDGGGEYRTRNISLENSYDAWVLWFHLSSFGDGTSVYHTGKRDEGMAVHTVYVGE